MLTFESQCLRQLRDGPIWENFLNRTFEVGEVAWSEDPQHWPICSRSFYNRSKELFLEDLSLLPLVHTFSATCTTTDGLNGMMLWIPGRPLKHLYLSLGPDVGAVVVQRCLERIHADLPTLESFSLQWDSQHASDWDIQNVGHALSELLVASKSLREIRVSPELMLVNEHAVWAKIVSSKDLHTMDYFPRILRCRNCSMPSLDPPASDTYAPTSQPPWPAPNTPVAADEHLFWENLDYWLPTWS